MLKTIKLLESIGQNTSIQQFDSIHAQLASENITENEINDLINSNIPLVCSWVPEDDEKDNDGSNNEEEIKILN